MFTEVFTIFLILVKDKNAFKCLNVTNDNGNCTHAVRYHTYETICICAHTL